MSMRRYAVLIFRGVTRAIVIASLVLCILSVWLWYRAWQGHRAIAQYFSRHTLPANQSVSASDPSRNYWLLDAMIEPVEEEHESEIWIGCLQAKAMYSQLQWPSGLECDIDYHSGLMTSPINLSFLIGSPDRTTTALPFDIAWFTSRSTTWNPGEPDEVITFHGVRMPMSNTVLAFAVLPYVWYCAFVVTFIRRRRKRRLGLCAKCGYDLRGTAEGRACPECGAAIPGRDAGTTAGKS